MRKYLLLWTVALIVGSLLSAPAFAECDHGGKYDKAHAKAECPHGCKHGKGGWLKELNLTDAQKDQLNQIKDNFWKNNKDTKKAMREARAKLREALKTKASKDDLRKQHRDLQALKMKFGEARFEKILAIRDILTSEQQKKFEGLRRKHGHSRKHKDK